jgi:hypothetical protein
LLDAHGPLQGQLLQCFASNPHGSSFQPTLPTTGKLPEGDAESIH